MDRVCYIFGAGEYGDVNVPADLQGFIIAADGGFLYLQKHHIRPDLLVGDFDSLVQTGDWEDCKDKPGESVSGKTPRDYMPDVQHIIRHPAEKDDTDMMLAVKEGFKRGYREFYIYGGLGGRLDHTLANIQTLEYIALQGGRGQLVGAGERLVVIHNDTLVLSGQQRAGRYISVFCLGDRAEGVRLKNLKYELEDAVLTKDFPLGVSNEFTGGQAQISVERGSLLVVMEG